MQLILPFDPSQETNGVIQVGAADAGSKMLLFNKSPYDLALDFYNGNQSIAHAKQARVWTLDGDTKQVGWSVYSQQNVITPAQTIIQGELYGPLEVIDGTFPVHLDTQTDNSNLLINTSQANFEMDHKDFTSGTKGNVFLTPSATQTAYITGFCLSAQPGAALLNLNVDIAGVNAAANPDYWIISTTTLGCFQLVTFPVAQPATAVNTAIGVRLLTNANAPTSLVVYGYFV